MTDNRTVVRALAGVYDAEATAPTALVNIHYPAGSIPPWDKPEIFWSAVIQDLERGRLKDGIGQLVAGAAEEFPASRRLQALDAEFRDGDGPSHPHLDQASATGQSDAAIFASEQLPRISSNRDLQKNNTLTGELLPLTGQQPETSGVEITMLARKRFRLPSIRRGREPSPVSLRGLRGFEFRSGRRILEPRGTEEYNFDNSGSSATSVETLHISNSTQFILQFDTQSATLRAGQASIGFVDFARLEGQLQSALRSRFSLTERATLTVERTSQINVPAHAHVRVILSWKRVWEEGVVVLHTDSGHDVQLPYRMTVELTFDKTQTNIA